MKIFYVFVVKKALYNLDRIDKLYYSHIHKDQTFIPDITSIIKEYFLTMINYYLYEQQVNYLN